MFGKTLTGKANKGTVGVSADKGYLRLSFPRQLFGGKQKFITLGLADTPENRAIAEKNALQVNLDISNNQFDFTLEKYKPQRHLTVVQPPQAKPQLTLDELWSRYVDFKKPSVSPSTRASDYPRMASHIAKLPTRDINDAVKIRDYLVGHPGMSADTLYRIKKWINTCCDWGVNSELIENNPFRKVFKDIKKPKSERRTDEDFEDINPFTPDERDEIIKAIETNKYCHPNAPKNRRHSNYAPYVKFLFFTGCRPSEAVALQWKHITVSEKLTTVLFEQAVVTGEDGLVLKKGLKTQKRRRINVSNRVKELLELIKPVEVNSDDLVFPSPVSKGWIDTHNFCNRVWKPLLAKMGIEYRKPYNMRHTYITLAREAGVDIKDLARVVGNSAEVLLKHYLGNTRDFQMPDT